MQASENRPKRIIVTISGASGAVYGVRLLEVLRAMGQVRTHLVVSHGGWLNLQQELDMTQNHLEDLADVLHPIHDVGANIASGSFQCDGMVIAPCSMRTLAAVAHGLSDNLITRAADVMLKERRRLILMVRETPLNLAHLRNMTSVTEMGGIIFPPVPGFYHRPQTIAEMIDHTVSRVIDLLGLPQPDAPRWTGFP
ncbi:MAG: UbiX family flavin prenyltransferase [Rhodoferax sp.]|uniref:UbiX family flavin prenyltransferase n=1 Tax=Rhodoferax sp. TaxID=50421 RepID=UPI00260FEB01|nr:UbiX family flavin prenyltransferase [Rhodoferax sp.]MDD2880786.1 UbiX family flavin prenyltransferase [Rhodoferax sp.]